MTILDQGHADELADFAVLAALSSLGTPEALDNQRLGQQLLDQHEEPNAETPAIDEDRLFAVAQHLHRAGLLGATELTYRTAARQGSAAAADALTDLFGRHGPRAQAHRRPGQAVVSEVDQGMTLDMITPFTRCPSMFGGQVWHFPRFENRKPLTLAAIGITLAGHEPTIMLPACGADPLAPPPDEADELTDWAMCGGCALIRYGTARPMPTLSTVAESTGRHRPRLQLVVPG